MQMNILEAKTNFSRLVRLLESGEEENIIIARHGKPVAQMLIYNKQPTANRIGIAKGKLKAPVDLDRDNEKIAALFGGSL